MSHTVFKNGKARTSATSSSWRITGARVATGATTAEMMDFEIVDGTIHLMDRAEGAAQSAEMVRTIDLTGYLVLPGLINAHDHLDFGLFPRLGHGPYRNFLEWAADIYQPRQSPVKEHLSVPKPARLWWGAIRNTLCGVTTVCHHNPPIPRDLRTRLPVRTVTRYTWAHSLVLGNDVAKTYRLTPADTPFVIHAGEGVDPQSRAEIFWLDRMRALGSNTVVVHGVGMDAAGHALLERRRSALVWCPTSNEFLLGTTLDLDSIRGHRRVALGSDSGLTAAGDLVDEMRFACSHAGASSEETYAMVTGQAAEVLKLTRGEGTLKEGAAADLIAFADDGGRPCDALSGLTRDKLELVMLDGRPKLLSPRLVDRWPGEPVLPLERIQMDGVARLIAAPVKNLINTARRHLGKEIRLAGKRITL